MPYSFLRIKCSLIRRDKKTGSFFAAPRMRANIKESKTFSAGVDFFAAALYNEPTDFSRKGLIA